MKTISKFIFTDSGATYLPFKAKAGCMKQKYESNVLTFWLAPSKQASKSAWELVIASSE